MNALLARLFNQWSQREKTSAQNAEALTWLDKLFSASVPVKVGLGLFIALILAVAIVLMVATFSKPHSQKTSDISPSHSMTAQPLTEVVKPSEDSRNMAQAQQTLEDINLRLAKLSEQEKSTHQKDHVFIRMSQVMSTIQQQVDELAKQPSTEEISKTINDQHEQLTQKIHQIESTLDTLKNEMSTTHYLDPNVLPFTVAAIEYWNERPYVRMIDKRRPYLDALDTVGDNQGLWFIQSIEPASQRVIFKNIKQQQVEVLLSRNAS